MLNKSVEQAISWFLYIGAAFTTVFITTGAVTDPVNETKLVAAGSLGVSVFLIAVVKGRQALRASSMQLLLISGLFILAMLNSSFNSEGPFSQNMYGTYGRQTGFVCYFVLALVAIGSSVIRDAASFEKIIKSLLIAGLINLAYCSWVLVFGDFIGWTNPYGNILGLFGNPDFISAFLGIFVVTLVAFVVGKKTKLITKVTVTFISLISFFEIHKSHAIQGLAVAGFGFALVGFYWLRSKYQSNLPTFAYLSVILILGSFSLAGALQKGPLAQYIYKTSVSLRGQYWKGGINMGTSHPFTGVGMDFYGEWWRRARTEYAATVLPGAHVITNASHNVVIDFFAFGGYPLLITYLGLLALGFLAIIRITFRNRKYDPIFVSLAVAWLCYELQSIISLNQVGLAIWGWVLLGALIAYEFSTRPSNLVEETTKTKIRNIAKKESVFSPQLIGGIGVVIGALVAVPPMSADMKWKAAIKSQQLPRVEEALQSGYMQPTSSMRLAQAVQTLEQSKLPDLAYKYAKQGVEFNPDYFDAWKMLYYISKSTPEDKALALKNMKRLDPRNPDVLKN